MLFKRCSHFEEYYEMLEMPVCTLVGCTVAGLPWPAAQHPHSCLLTPTPSPVGQLGEQEQEWEDLWAEIKTVLGREGDARQSPQPTSRSTLSQFPNSHLGRQPPPVPWFLPLHPNLLLTVTLYTVEYFSGRFWSAVPAVSGWKKIHHYLPWVETAPTYLRNVYLGCISSDT